MKPDGTPAVGANVFAMAPGRSLGNTVTNVEGAFKLLFPPQLESKIRVMARLNPPDGGTFMADVQNIVPADGPLELKLRKTG